MQPAAYERPEKQQIALSFLQAEELLTPIVGKLEHPHPADQEVPSWDFDSLSFTHLVFPYEERRIKVVGAGRPDALDVPVTTDQLVEAVRALMDVRWGYLSSIVGVDPGIDTGELEVLYIFCHGAAVLVLTMRIPRDVAVVPSICNIIPSASFFERELSEMFGIVVEGTPNPDRLFLADEWPAAVYPLRKDYEVPSTGDSDHE